MRSAGCYSGDAGSLAVAATVVLAWLLDAVLITDFTGKLQYVNQALQQMFDQPADEEMIGKSIRDFVSVLPPNDWQDSMVETLNAAAT